MIERELLVLYLGIENLNKEGLSKSFDEINHTHFKFLINSKMLKSEIVIYREDDKYKVLKSRY